MLRRITVAEACELLKTAGWGMWEEYPQSEIDKVLVLAKAMINGSFDPTQGMPIRVGRDGMLKNGRHRLVALILTGCPQMLAIDDNRL